MEAIAAANPATNDAAFLAGGGKLGELIRAKDWAATPLGPVVSWPQSLRTSVSTCLNCSFPILIWWGPELVKMYNDAYAAIIAAKHPHALGSAGRDVWPEIWDTIGPMLARVMDAGEAFPADDLRLDLHRKGYLEECYFSFSYSPIRNETGQIAGVFCPVMETTARVFGERRAAFLLNLEYQLRAAPSARAACDAACEAIGRALDGVICTFNEFDPDGEHIEVTSEWRADSIPSVLGRHRLADWGAARVADLLSGMPERVEDICADLRTAGTATEAAYTALGCRASMNVPLVRDGRVRAMLAIGVAAPRRWSDDQVALALETVDRVWQATERVRTERRLRELNETLEQRVAETAADLDRVWRNAGDIFIMIDSENGVFQRVNPATTAILGWSEAELLGHPVFDFMHPDDIERSFAAMERTRSNVLPAFENRYRTKDGDWRTIAWVAAPEGQVIYCYGRDVTAEKVRQLELETAREALRQSQKMEAMGQLTGGVAHDFNNLLTPIVGGLDMLQRKGLGGEREQRLIAGAMQSAERAKTLVQRLLAFARRQPLQSIAVDIAKLIAGMGDLVSSTTGPQIKVVIEAPDDLPPAKADPNQLEMALLNLCVNARDAMPDGGTLRVSTSAEMIDGGHCSKLRPDIYIRLSVADTGAGMDEATLARAIEPFFSTKGVGKGTGLGLSMVHGLASQLGGALTIRSRPGLGTNVELWLPVSTAVPEAVEVMPERGVATTARGTALLVDDEELVRMSTADMLNDLGYEVIEAASGEEAMRIIEGGERFDLLVTDHLMPGMTGIDLVNMVRERRPSLPVLVISGYAEDEGIEVDIPRLTKPFRKVELASSLQALQP